MRIRTNGWVHRLLREAVRGRTKAEQELLMYKTALENAYEGLVICDADGIIVTINATYASFLGRKQEDMIGRHVTEVIENTRMHIVAKTGKAEIADLQQVGGHRMIATRIPIWSDGRVVAVAGKIVFQDIDNLFEMNSKFREYKRHLLAAGNEPKERAAGAAKYEFRHLIGTSDAMMQVKRLAQRAAKTNSTVLLTGESGTGKELFAHAIHRDSQRFYGPFVAMNCAAVPESLFESELFGYKEGSFTGATRSGKKGKVTLANKGTLFLDEVGELPLVMQAKLLRVLQEKEVEPVGASFPEPVDVRIIAASNRDLLTLVEQGTFRRDLYYRLHVIELRLPPLRERKEDIAALAETLLVQVEREMGMRSGGLTSEAIEKLRRYDWPGNVRELRNVLERAMLLQEGPQLTAAHIELPPHRAQQGIAPFDHDDSLQGRTLKERLQQAEAHWMAEALRLEHGDAQAAAKRLGMSKSSFYYKWKEIQQTSEGEQAEGEGEKNR